MASCCSAPRARARRSAPPSGLPRWRHCSPAASRRRGSLSAPASRRSPIPSRSPARRSVSVSPRRSILPPYFYRDAGEAGIEDAFAAILDGVADDRLRATLYHIPQVSGVAVPPAVAARLSARYRRVLAGLKDSSAEFAQFRAFRAAAPELAITVGSEADIGRALAEGGAGTICGMGNIAPALVRAMFGPTDASGPMRAALALMDGPFLPTLKATLAAMTGRAGWSRMRAPLRAAPAEAGEAVAAGLRRLAMGRAA